MKKYIILLLPIFIFANCKEYYIDINKHSRRADLFKKAYDWDMLDFYIKKLKKDYSLFISEKCFNKVFEEDNQDRMKKIYKKNIKKIKELSEMTKETIKEKRRLERIKIIEQYEDKKERERVLLREEIRKELLNKK